MISANAPTPRRDPAPLVPAAPVITPVPRSILDPGLDLTLRPMRYPQFYEMYRTAIRNTWTVEEVDLSEDLTDLRTFAVVDVLRQEEPGLFDADFERQVVAMLDEAIEAETVFAADMFGSGVAGLSLADTRQYLQPVADQRLRDLRLSPRFGAGNPFPFMQLQNVKELSNFFERTVSAYQLGVAGAVAFDEDF